MVNYGVSRACATCKRRHKKCDETRPACKRCTKTKFICPGYKDETDLIFRRYPGQASITPSSQNDEYSQSRRATSLPSGLHQNLFTNIEAEQAALASFLDDYCVSSKDKTLSRGYLDNLEYLLAHGDLSSDLANATKAASLASLGNKLGEPDLLLRAKASYSELLASFQQTMSNSTTSKTLESLATAVLLGLYEIISAGENDPGEHRTHYRGVAAILSSEESIFSRYSEQAAPGSSLALPEHPSTEALQWPYEYTMLSPLDATDMKHSLDDLLLRVSPIFRKCQVLQSQISLSLVELRELRESVMLVDREFALWPARQAEEWMPKSIGLVAKGGVLGDTTYSPTHADTYFDVYVSSVWNCYRKCRLQLLNCIYACSERLRELDSNDTSFLATQQYVFNEAQTLAESIAASIPFHLTRNPESFVANHPPRTSNPGEVPVPNKSISGLLIMYVIYVVSRLPIVTMPMREMFSQHLAWIGRVMGIGQASLLADPSVTFPKEFLSDGHILVWAGTLILRKDGEDGIAKLRYGFT